MEPCLRRFIAMLEFDPFFCVAHAATNHSQCQWDQTQGQPAVEKVLDSSRYFVLRIEVRKRANTRFQLGGGGVVFHSPRLQHQGRHAYVGLVMHVLLLW